MFHLCVCFGEVSKRSSVWLNFGTWWLSPPPPPLVLLCKKDPLVDNVSKLERGRGESSSSVTELNTTRARENG